jgi:hypothetical protein
MSSQQSEWGTTAYEGLNDLGVFKANILMVITGIVATIMLIIGSFYIYTDDDEKYLRVQGTVMQADCAQSITHDYNGKPNTSYKCNVLVDYKIDGKVYSKTIFVNNGSSSYLKDEPVDLVVSKNNYNDVQLAFMKKATTGIIMISLSILVVGLVYLNYYLTHNYKIFSAAQGTRTIFDVFGL